MCRDLPRRPPCTGVVESTADMLAPSEAMEHPLSLLLLSFVAPNATRRAWAWSEQPSASRAGPQPRHAPASGAGLPMRRACWFAAVRRWTASSIARNAGEVEVGDRRNAAERGEPAVAAADVSRLRAGIGAWAAPVSAPTRDASSQDDAPRSSR